MRTHGYHWFDKARMAHDPHPDPIRSGPLLYNIFIRARKDMRRRGRS
jgi:hypothetical protein